MALVSIFLATPATLADIEPPTKELPTQTASSTDAFCSCVKYLHTLLPSAPYVDAKWFKDFPKATPSIGGVAVFYYPGSGQYHVGYIIKFQDGGFVIAEANFYHCQKDTRFIAWDDPRLIGFWKAP